MNFEKGPVEPEDGPLHYQSALGPLTARSHYQVIAREPRTSSPPPSPLYSVGPATKCSPPHFLHSMCFLAAPPCQWLRWQSHQELQRFPPPCYQLRLGAL